MNRAPAKEYVPLPLIEDMILRILEELPVYDIFSFCLCYPETFGVTADYVLKKKLREGIEAEIKFIFTSLFKGDFLGKSEEEGCYSSKGFIIFSDLTEEDVLGEEVRKYETEYSFKIFQKDRKLFLQIEKNRLCIQAGIISTSEYEIPKGYVAFENMVQTRTSKMLRVFPEGFKIRWMGYDIELDQ